MGGLGARRLRDRRWPLPRYEFFCETCNKPFETILTLAEYEKGEIACPKCSGTKVHQETAEFFVVTSKKS